MLPATPATDHDPSSVSPEPARRTLELTLDTAVSPPNVAFTVRRGEQPAGPAPATKVGVDLARPHLPYADRRFDAVVALDVLEHVLDEEHWLAELARITRPGATLKLRVPAAGPFSWLDALNLYRYVVETSHRGTAPRQTQPVGWHRHYGRRELVAMLTTAGFRPQVSHRDGSGLAEAPRLAGLIALDWLLGLPHAERRLQRAIAPLERLDDRLPTGSLGTRLVVEATRL